MAAKGRKGSSAMRTRSTYKPKPKATGKGKLENDLKKQDQKAPSPADSPSRISSSPTKGLEGFDFEELADGTLAARGFSTPKAPKHRIPKIETCPPAPKRQRVVDALDDRSSMRRQITFFAPPELEVFFLLSHGGSISG